MNNKYGYGQINLTSAHAAQSLICRFSLIAFLLVVSIMTAPVALARAEVREPAPHTAASVTASALKIAAGQNHTCAITISGGAKCWGDNAAGQLGNGTTVSQNTPVDVSGLTQTVSAVDAGYLHTCALTTSGGVKCWGSNDMWQLGDGTAASHYTPADVSGLTQGVSAIALGDYYSCALTISGGVKCWGSNDVGQLGDGTNDAHQTPVDVLGLTSGVSAIASGSYFVCAVMTAGGVKCWGNNLYGQLGDGTLTDRHTPGAVSGLSNGISALTTGGAHACVQTSSGVECWGYNGAGQVGDGTTTSRAVPVAVSGLISGVSAIAAGRNHTCASMTAGGVKCWGWNSVGQLGDGSITDRLTPVAVSGLSSRVIALEAGFAHTCAVIEAAGIQCWGWNSAGQLGDGTELLRLDRPEVVPGLDSGMSAVAAGYAHGCAVTAEGGATCWGNNYDGELGGGTITPGPIVTSRPVNVIGLASGVSQVGAGASHSCALTTNGGVQCWGNNDAGQLGDGTTISRTTPMTVIGLNSGIAALGMGYYHTCALTSSGGVQCWGRNDLGQLGDGTLGSKLVPVDVIGLSSGVSSIVASFERTCAVMVTGGVKCWGGDIFKVIPPADVPGLTSGVQALALGILHTCALMTTGGVKCWGENTYGQLGDGTVTKRATPTDVIGLTSGVRAIAAGFEHTCALMTGGGVKCWGQNFSGEVGDGTTTHRLVPVDVLGLSNRVRAITLGADFGCALMTTGSIQCWGDNSYGQTAAYPTWTPVDVLGSAGFMQAWSHFVFVPNAVNEK